MTITFRTNSIAIQTRGSLSKALKDQAAALKRLSSGMRINSAKDDAAGLGIADRLQTKIRSGFQVGRNIQDGLSYAQTGDAALDEVQNLLQRGRELAVQAANGTLSDSDRRSLNEEFRQIKDQIDHIAQNTQIFGRRPLQADPGPPNIRDLFEVSGKSLHRNSGVIPMSFIPAGSVAFELEIDSFGWDDDIQIFTRDGKHLAGTDLNDIVWAQNGISSGNGLEALFTQANGFFPGASYDGSFLNSGRSSYEYPLVHTTTYNGMTLGYSGDADRTGPGDGNNDGIVGFPQTWERFQVDVVTESLIVFVVGRGEFSTTASWEEIPETTLSEKVRILVDTTPKGDDSYIVFDKTPADTVSLGIADDSLDPAEAAREALDTLQRALEKTSGYRGYYGGKMNALDHRSAVLNQEIESHSSARSRIQDADMAQEATSAARSSIHRDAAASLLAQANQLPQLILGLLR